jgi:anti-sigma regulatory factor (Ser/Thr protein kinase)
LGTVALPAGIAAPGAARIVVAHCLRGLVAPRVLEDAQLLVTELVTNCVLHGELRESDAVCVRVFVGTRSVRIEVENPGTAGSLAASGADPQAGRGFGLEMMEHLATRWGVHRHGTTSVWFERERT